MNGDCGIPDEDAKLLPLLLLLLPLLLDTDGGWNLPVYRCDVLGRELEAFESTQSTNSKSLLNPEGVGLEAAVASSFSSKTLASC